MFGLKSRESAVEYFEEDQPEADVTRDPGNPMANDITTSGTGDAIRGRTDGTTNGTDGRVSSSGHTIGGSRHAETVPTVLRTNRSRTEGESDSERNEVQDKRHERKKEHKLRQQTHIQRKAVQT